MSLFWLVVPYNGVPYKGVPYNGYWVYPPTAVLYTSSTTYPQPQSICHRPQPAPSIYIRHPRCSLSRCSRRSNALCHPCTCTPLIVLIFRITRCRRCSFTMWYLPWYYTHSFQDPKQYSPFTLTELPSANWPDYAALALDTVQTPFTLHTPQSTDGRRDSVTQVWVGRALTTFGKWDELGWPSLCGLWLISHSCVTPLVRTVSTYIPLRQCEIHTTPGKL